MEIIERASRVQEGFRLLRASGVNRPPAVFGREARTAYRLAQAGAGGGEGPPLSRFLTRPASEAVLTAWRGEGGDPSGIASLERLALGLTGQPQPIRAGPHQSKPRDGMITVYPPAEAVRDLLAARDARRLADAPHPLIWAIIRLLDFTQIHPFKDGNGRTARALFQLDLVTALEIDPLFCPWARSCTPTPKDCSPPMGGSMKPAIAGLTPSL